MLSQLGQFVRLKPPELKKEEPDMRIGAFLNQGIVCKITWHLEKSWPFTNMSSCRGILKNKLK